MKTETDDKGIVTMGGKMTDKLSPGDALADAVEGLLGVLQPMCSQHLRVALAAYRADPKLPSPERILERSKMTEKVCPMKFSWPADGRDGCCERERCAWWEEFTGSCGVVSLAWERAREKSIAEMRADQLASTDTR